MLVEPVRNTVGGMVRKTIVLVPFVTLLILNVKLEEVFPPAEKVVVKLASATRFVKALVEVVPTTKLPVVIEVEEVEAFKPLKTQKPMLKAGSAAQLLNTNL